MKYISCFFLFSLLYAMFFVEEVYAEDYGNLLGVTYVRLYDGDTIYVNIPNVHPILGDEIPVRLARVDTPEIRGKCDEEKSLAYQAKLRVKEILENASQIDLKHIERGKYFRIVAEVYADDVNISNLLLEENLAYLYTGGKKKSWCGQ